MEHRVPRAAIYKIAAHQECRKARNSADFKLINLEAELTGSLYRGEAERRDVAAVGLEGREGEGVLLPLRTGSEGNHGGHSVLAVALFGKHQECVTVAVTFRPESNFLLAGKVDGLVGMGSGREHHATKRILGTGHDLAR